MYAVMNSTQLPRKSATDAPSKHARPCAVYREVHSGRTRYSYVDSGWHWHDGAQCRAE